LGVRVVNVKELKARLSAYLRDVERGDEFLVTHRGKVIAHLGPAGSGVRQTAPEPDAVARLVALGARPPVRGRRTGDYLRGGPPSGLATSRIDALLDDARGER
jgi:prevent-host-death family protein